MKKNLQAISDHVKQGDTVKVISGRDKGKIGEVVKVIKNENKVVVKEGYPNADYVMRNGILLPLHHGLNEEMFVKLPSTIELFLSKYI